MNGIPRTYVFLAVAAIALALQSCEESNVGTIDTQGRPPFLRDGSITPDRFVLSLIPPVNGLHPLTIAARVKIFDPDNLAGAKVYAVVYGPSSNSPILEQQLFPRNPQLDSLYDGSIRLNLGDSDVGLYHVRFVGVDNTGLDATSLYLPFIVTRLNTPPQIGDLVAPDTITVPPPVPPDTVSSLSFTMSVAASDPDGSADIREVYFRSLDSSDPNSKYFLRDDGGVGTPSSGDVTAGDGRYTIRVTLTSRNEKKTYRFAFQAMDLLSDTSSTILHYLTVR